MDSAEYFKPSNVTLRARRDFRIAEGVGHRYLLHRARLNLAWANVSAFYGGASLTQWFRGKVVKVSELSAQEGGPSWIYDIDYDDGDKSSRLFWRARFVRRA